MSQLVNTEPALGRGWLPVALSIEVSDQPTRVWLLGRPYVACRLGPELVVLPDRCPHRLTPLSTGAVVDGRLQCGYHGWCFGPDGRCTDIPSLGPGATLPPRAHLTPPWGVTERYGVVFVALQAPVAGLLEVPGLVPSATGRLTLKSFAGRFGAGLLIDNQLDTSHFAFLHRATFGTAAAALIAPYEVRRDADGWGFSVRSETPISARNDPGAADGTRPLAQHRVMNYHYRAPLQLSLLLEYPAMGISHQIAFFAQPAQAEAARLFSIGVMERPGGFDDDEFSLRAEFENRVGAEDRAMQASFDELGLPLDLTAECHVRADRASIEFRRILAALCGLKGRDEGATDGAAEVARERVIRC